MKLVLVMALFGVHGWVVRAVRGVAGTGRTWGVRFHVAVVVASGLLVIATVTLAVVKPL